MLTATLLGAVEVGIVVVGPLKQASEFSRRFQTSSEIYELPPFFFHHSDPASHGTNLIFELHSFSTWIIASTSSGPVPSPLIITADLLNPYQKCYFLFIPIWRPEKFFQGMYHLGAENLLDY